VLLHNKVMSVVGVLTDEVPHGSLSGISPGYKATPKGLDDAMASTGLSSTLAP